MDEQQPHRHEPAGLKGSRVVLLFFLVLALITVASYLVFRFVLNIPSA